MNFNDINAAIESLRVTKDGNAFCITRSDFRNLQESPAVFFDDTSAEGIILERWQVSPCPLRHLPAIWIFPILKELGVTLKDESARGE